MTGWDIEAWQLSILVTAAIILVETAVNALLRRRLSIAVHRHFRTGALAALLILTVIVFVTALGPSLADELSSVAAAVAAVVALWLTYRSYHSPRDKNLGGTAAPASPDTPPPSAQRILAPPTSPDAGPPEPDHTQPVPSPTATTAVPPGAASAGPPAAAPGASQAAAPAVPPVPRPRSIAPAQRLRRLLLGRKSQRRG